MSLEKASETSADVDITNRRGKAGPRARVLCELWILRLEEDLDTIKGADYRLCLHIHSQLATLDETSATMQLGEEVLTAQPAKPPASPLFIRYSGLFLSSFFFAGTMASLSVGHIGGYFSMSRLLARVVRAAVVVMILTRKLSSWRRSVVIPDSA